MSSSKSQIALSVRGLSKSYTIRHTRSVRQTTLAGAITDGIRHPLRRQTRETFSALKDVSFEVAKGEVVGIIGRNGAGKSTLLKILSRITAPTAGEVDLYGRVGSLLEVGTGFHQELTGRENVYLNGAILGMTRAEIRSQFDAIVDFAGVEHFLDTPVKHYSSGMYVRLAFAVAAHLRSEILLVDEVLAVGDAEFQRKCLTKLKATATDGRTVLFVSHHMHSVSLLCDIALLLERGRLVISGEVERVIRHYSQGFERHTSTASEAQERGGSGEFRFANFSPAKRCFDPNEVKQFRFDILQYRPRGGRFYLSAHLMNEMGLEIARFDSRLPGTWGEAAIENCELSFSVPWLKPGKYRVDAYICTGAGIIDAFEGASYFDVSEVLPYPCSTSHEGMASGVVLADFVWSLNDRRAIYSTDSAVPLSSQSHGGSRFVVHT